MKRFVLDTSVAVAFLLPDEQSELASGYFEEAVQQRVELCAPQLLPFEVANVLRSAVKRNRISTDEAMFLMAQFQQLPVQLEPVLPEDVVAVALEHDLSAYDAAYVWLSQSQDCQLLTFDQKLQAWAEGR